MKHGVLAIDPGETTGVYAGICDLQDSANATFQTRTRVKAAEVKGDYLEQARELTRIFGYWSMDCARFGVGLPNQHVAIEDFVLRRRQEGGATGNLTSIWVAAAFVGMSADLLVRIDLRYQMAGEALNYATGERLKRWGLWEVGSTHKRAASSHWAHRMNDLIDE